MLTLELSKNQYFVFWVKFFCMDHFYILVSARHNYFPQSVINTFLKIWQARKKSAHVKFPDPNTIPVVIRQTSSLSVPGTSASHLLWQRCHFLKINFLFKNSFRFTANMHSFPQHPAPEWNICYNWWPTLIHHHHLDHFSSGESHGLLPHLI